MAALNLVRDLCEQFICFAQYAKPKVVRTALTPARWRIDLAPPFLTPRFIVATLRRGVLPPVAARGICLVFTGLRSSTLPLRRAIDHTAIDGRRRRRRQRRDSVKRHRPFPLTPHTPTPPAFVAIDEQLFNVTRNPGSCVDHKSASLWSISGISMRSSGYMPSRYRRWNGSPTAWPTYGGIFMLITV